MVRLRVPAKAVRWYLAGGCCLLVIGALLGGLAIGAAAVGGGLYEEGALAAHLSAASPSAADLPEPARLLLDENLAHGLLARRGVRAVWRLDRSPDSPLGWTNTTDGSVVLPEAVSRSLFAGRDQTPPLFQAAGSPWLFQAIIRNEGGRQRAWIVAMDDPLSDLPLPLSARVPLDALLAVIAGHWLILVLLWAVAVLAIVIFVFHAVQRFLVIPVREFAQALSDWDSGTYPDEAMRGPFRYLMRHVLELAERSGSRTRSRAALLPGDLLPLRRGFDLPGINAGAAWVRTLPELKDYFDIFPIDGGRLAIYMGEVSGRDHAAAFTAARLAWWVRAFSRSLDHPARVIAEVNRNLLAEELATPVSLFLGFLNVASRELVFSQAGGMPLFRFRPADGSVESFHLEGPPAGLLDQESFSAELSFAGLTLEPGDTLGLFSDGVLKLSGFDWESKARAVFAGPGNIAERLIRFRQALEEAGADGRLEDDVFTLFVEVPV